jgi:hypothetical protein
MTFLNEFHKNINIKLEKQLIKPKVQRLPDGNHSMKPTSTPSTSNTCNSLIAKPMMLNFCEELVHLAKEN